MAAASIWAAAAAWKPEIASSTTRQSCGVVATRSAARRKTSGSGLECCRPLPSEIASNSWVICSLSRMGVGMRLTPGYGEQLTQGILNLMHTQGMWTGPVIHPRTPIVSRDKVAFLNADAPGIFVPKTVHSGTVKKG